MRVSNRELARWLSEGNGEIRFKYCELVITSYNYEGDKAGDEVPEDCLVRRWDDSVWNKPTREYIYGN